VSDRVGGKGLGVGGGEGETCLQGLLGNVSESHRL